MVFGWLKRKRKKEEEEFPEKVTTPLPEDLERFKVTRESEPPLPPVTGPFPKASELVSATEASIETQDKMDLILQKLETIDVRLKLLEEKLGV